MVGSESRSWSRLLLIRIRHAIVQIRTEIKIFVERNSCQPTTISETGSWPENLPVWKEKPRFFWLIKAGSTATKIVLAILWTCHDFIYINTSAPFHCKLSNLLDNLSRNNAKPVFYTSICERFKRSSPLVLYVKTLLFSRFLHFVFRVIDWFRIIGIHLYIYWPIYTVFRLWFLYDFTVLIIYNIYDDFVCKKAPPRFQNPGANCCVCQCRKPVIIIIIIITASQCSSYV